MLRKLFKNFRYGKKGFTLIELLVVVAILGVLAAVAIPNVSKFIGKGSVEAANTELNLVYTAISSYQADNKTATIPASWATTAADVTTALGVYIQSGLAGTYTAAQDATTGAITVTGVTAPNNNVTWDSTNNKWK